jgi:CDP-glycerol glycerophosphotransferase
MPTGARGGGAGAILSDGSERRADPHPVSSELRSTLGRVRRRAAAGVRSERLAHARSRPIDPSLVVYESFAGNGVLCNPEAIFRRLLADPGFSHLTHVWAISDASAARRFDAEFAGHPHVRRVSRGGAAYWRAVSTAGHLVNNATFPPAFGKRPGQVYLNTWHGTPLKRMGFDMPDGAFESANTLRNLLMADFLLAANPFMAETMYEGAYRLGNIYGGRIIEEGYPRIDRQVLAAGEDVALRRELDEAGVAVGARPLVIFAPTWRGSSFADPSDDLDELAHHLEQLQTGLGSGVVVVLKVHQVVHALAARRPALRGRLVPNAIPTNVLLGAAAGLVTDYSSIFFDYLATGRPIAFLVPDAAGYAESRGTYVSVDALPGPVVSDAREAGRRLRMLLDDAPPHPAYDDWRRRFTPFEDGHATERVVDIVFRGGGGRMRPARRDGRQRLLLHLGGMRSNGITTSALNLLDAIDHDRYDVTALMPLYRSQNARSNQRRIHPAVRQVFRVGGMNGSKLSQLRRHVDDWRDAPLPPRARPWHTRLWDDEWRRVLGSAEFDWVADFSGYSPFWANLLLHAPGARRAIWLHNEMAADRRRTVAGRQPMNRSLALVFALYGSYHDLVSVSPRLTALNSRELAGYAPADRFTTVRNLPAPDAAAPVPHELDTVLEPGETRPGWLAELSRPDRTGVWFVSVGRLSTEKNHARLLRAFAQVHRDHPSTRLLLVGGGPLRSELEHLIRSLGLDDCAHLAGPRRDPSVLMQAADCFVLSSTYEGQPMVLLEAARCGMPIVSTAFASVSDALPGDAIHVVAQDDAALRDGMLDYLAGRVAPSTIDAAAYTADVLAELDRTIDAPQGAAS